ncbi:NAD(+)/NADH kinase, partial [Candidatus Micrarchaeota archaeon]|nr:NAD(+)/NADH kinase [Candidatus Micrarchaeota archaeon]
KGIVGWAINDVVVHSRKHNVIAIKSNVVADFEGDGIIIATPTGSTGYAYSAGGKRMMHSEEKIQIVPICPYLRKVKSRILSKNKIVRVNIGGEADLIIDGQKIIKVNGNNIEVKADKTIDFVKVN